MKALNTVKALTYDYRKNMALDYVKELKEAMSIIDEFQRLIDAPEVTYEGGEMLKFTDQAGIYSIIFGSDGKPLCAKILKSKYK